MVRKLIIGMALVVVGIGNALAQTYTAEQHIDMRITGMLLMPDAPRSDDIVLVNISVQNKPLLLRLGKVEDLTPREKTQVAKGDVLLRQVRFTGPDKLMERLLEPDAIGKPLRIEGWLNAQDRLFQVTAVSEAPDAMPAWQGH
jgi:hypothetical protein